MKMKVSRKDGMKRRDELLDAALRCFAKGGILGCGIEAIRREAGASPSSVYNLFSGLDAIIGALLERTFARLCGYVESRLREASGAEAAVRALVDAYFEWVLGQPDEARFMYQATALELAGVEKERIAGSKAVIEAPILELLRPYLESGELPPLSPQELDLVLLGPSHEACRRYFSGSNLDLGRLRRLLPGLAWASVSRDRGDNKPIR